MNTKYKKVYLITDPRKNLIDIVEKYCKLGIGMIQYRNKNISDEKFILESNKLFKIANKYNITYIVNDRYWLNEFLLCDGYHIGQNDGTIKNVRKVIGNKKLGISVHNINEAIIAKENKVDLIGVGALFKTNTKSDANYVTIESLEEINKVFSEIAIIGGINNNTIKKIPSSFYKWICCSSYLLDSSEPEKSLKKLKI